MPYNVSGELQITASADIGRFGPTVGKPVICYFSPLYHLQGFVPWLILPLAFVALKENRSRQAAWILAPIASVELVYSTVVRLLKMDSSSIVQLNVMVTIMVVGFSVIWLLAGRMGNRNKLVTFLLAVLIYYGFLGLNLLSAGFGKDIIAISWLAGVSIPAIMLAFVIAALCSRKTLNTSRFVIYVGVTLFGSLLTIFSAIMFVVYPAPNTQTFAKITEVLTASLFGALIYWAGLLPFLIMLFANSFWLKRFEAVFGIRTRIDIPAASQTESS